MVCSDANAGDDVIQGLLTEGRECKRQLDRKVAEYDAARLKHLGHKANPRPSKWRKGEDSEKIQSDMVQAQVIPHPARRLPGSHCMQICLTKDNTFTWHLHV